MDYSIALQLTTYIAVFWLGTILPIMFAVYLLRKVFT